VTVTPRRSDPLAGDPGWRELRPPEDLERGPSWLSADGEPQRLAVRYYTADGHRVLARVRFGPGCQGPPGHAHGGSIASVLDEAMGVCAWLGGHPALAARLEVAFRRPVPLGTVATAEAWVVGVEGRKVRIAARLTADGTLLAEAEGLFVTLPRERILGMGRESARGQGPPRPTDTR